MKAAVVQELGKPPTYGDFAAPEASAGKVVVRVVASAISPVTRSRAAGHHYTSREPLPFVAGIDGVGFRVSDNRRVYFMMPEAPFGSMAQWTLVDDAHVIELPESIESNTAAAIAIPGMSSWAALRTRAALSPGETVLINGATGASGRLAVQIARHLGAGKVIGTGRDSTRLAQLRLLGADEVVSLDQDAAVLDDALQKIFAQGVDVVLDYLWGPAAEALLVAAAKAGPERARIRYVEIGSASGQTISLPSAVLRSSSIELLGSGMNSVPMRKIKEAIEGVFGATAPEAFDIAIRTVPLENLASAWADESRDRIVLTVD